MKKLLTILLIAFFAVGFSSCAEESLDTDPVIPEVSQDAIDKLQDQKSTTVKRRGRTKQRTNHKTVGIGS